ncbi:MAG TPA: cation transporter, partial [Steroidobacteraceae bacterium]|nr:cation transporter [Steroidobacteraceae bacterium]
MAEASAKVLRAKIAGMDCGSCALTIEDGLRQLPGARRVSVDFTTETLALEGEVSREQVERRLRQLGYRLADAAPGGSAPAAAPAGGPVRFFLTDPQQQVALVATLAVLGVSLFAWLSEWDPARFIFSFTCAAAAAVVGTATLLKGLRALWFGRRFSIELLMTVAALGALCIGEMGEAATVVLLFTFGEGLERFSATRARESLKSLMSLQPQVAPLIRAHSADAPGHGAAAGHGAAHEPH